MALGCDWPNATYLSPPVTETLSEGDLTERVRAALAQPEGYPPLVSATAPGDRVVLAAADRLPQAGPSVFGAMLACFDAGVSPQSLVIVGRHRVVERVTLYLRSAAEEFLESVQLLTHDAADEQASAMLGVTLEGEPVRLNREVCEADVVVSLGTVGGAADRPESDFLTGLYPGLSDTETLRQFEPGPDSDSDLNLVDRVHDGVWRLGLGLAVAVVPGPDGGVADAVAGLPSTLRGTLPQRVHDAWTVRCERSAELVVAELTGPAPQQTWDAIASAVTAAERCAKPDAPIVLRSLFEEPLGLAFSRLVEEDSLDRFERQVRKDRAEHSRAAITLARAIDRRPVFLQSAMQPSVVEALGMTPLADDYELERLVDRHDSVVVLADAQHLLPEVAETRR